MLKSLPKIAGTIFALIIVLLAIGWFNRTSIFVWMLNNETISTWLTTFEPSEDYESSVVGSYPVAACQNSHVDWGEKARRTISLNGSWDVAQGERTDKPPADYRHKVPVPGLITEARPAFTEMGIESDQRDIFWYRTTFTAPEEASAQAFLCLHKAKNGVKVWLNGEPLGEHYGTFSLSEYNGSKAIRYGQANELVVRLGADRSQLPSFVPAGDDDEKDRWYPGLWDSVSLVLTDELSIANVKIEPDIDRKLVRIKTIVLNGGAKPYEGWLSQKVTPWLDENGAVGPAEIETAITVAPGERQTILQTVDMPTFELWSPETPFLYRAHTTLGGGKDGIVGASDDRVNRFGMRKVEWRSGTDKGFYLNNRLYYLRGTNIGLHRFFEDAERGELPWDEKWVRALLSGHPKDFHWNSFRNHTGRLPNFWYDLADEIGFIVADEYSFWSVVRGTESEGWSIVELEKEFRGWISENWNHASIGWWDAANENHNPLSDEVIRRVRAMDPTRQWENGGYRPPVGPNDPIEEHPYKLNAGGALNLNDRRYTLDDFTTMEGQPPQATWGPFATYSGAPEHPFINNEYAFLWVTHRGRPTELAKLSFENIAEGKVLTPKEYLEAYAYLTAELSAYWRAMRGYAGVQHFVYLSKCNDEADVPEGWEVRTTSKTCDNFLDVKNLKLEPRWARYARSAFAPQLIYLRAWDEASYPRGKRASVPVILLNDDYNKEDVVAEILAIDANGRILSRSEPVDMVLEPVSRRDIKIELDIPQAKRLLFVARLTSPSGAFDPVYGRRKIGYDHVGKAIPDPPFRLLQSEKKSIALTAGKRTEK
ncbi:MAG: glycoside hydrolase family 2 TIM barrel-domain containing protein [Parasphingorhabdus sp.]|uniref:glycoside hydrolase family 2 protein n=1 Tax=Parasphingorhabdus sp. TaxID=2709688 RepID=UPI00329A5DF9